jgi:putative membrane protein insertion efficiency factor
MKRILINLIKKYQVVPGPWHDNCRFTPTCSHYAIDAIEEYGSFKGGLMAIYRIIRCNPFSKGGYDPVKGGNMKKKNLLLLLLIPLFLSGCIKRDEFENIDIYTSVYPIEYITSRLYGTNSNVYSIYPDGILIDEYTLTDKQINDYSKANMFIFSGLFKDKDYVLPMFNENKNIRIIDSTLSMEYSYDKEEIWLDPSNFLMLAQNIRNGLKEYINNGYLKNEIDEKYEQLKLEVSNIDAKIKLMVESASDKTIVVGNDLYNFLSKYGLNVISLEENENLTDKKIEEVKALIVSGSIKHIYLKQNEDANDTIKALIKDTEVTIINLHDIANLSEDERSNRLDYISLVNANIELLKEELYD